MTGSGGRSICPRCKSWYLRSSEDSKGFIWMKKKTRESIHSCLAVVVLFEESPLYFPTTPTEAGLWALETLMATPETRLICQNPLYIMGLLSPQFSLPRCELCYVCQLWCWPLSPLFSYLLPYSVFLVTIPSSPHCCWLGFSCWFLQLKSYFKSFRFQLPAQQRVTDLTA